MISKSFGNATNTEWHDNAGTHTSPRSIPSETRNRHTTSARGKCASKDNTKSRKCSWHKASDTAPRSVAGSSHPDSRAHLPTLGVRILAGTQFPPRRSKYCLQENQTYEGFQRHQPNRGVHTCAIPSMKIPTPKRQPDSHLCHTAQRDPRANHLQNRQQYIAQEIWTYCEI